MIDLPLLLDMAVSNDPGRTAVTGPDGRSLTGLQLSETAKAASSLFSTLEGTHIGFCGTSGVAFPVSLFGASMAGRPFVPLNYRLGDDQLGLIIQSHDLAVVADPVQAVRLRNLGVERILEVDELLGASSAASLESPLSPVSPDDVALVLYTSGTTSRPKAAILRHRHLTTYILNTIELGASTPEDAALLAVPPYHIAGVMNLLSNLYMGRRIVYMSDFDAARWLDLVESDAITHAMLVPTMLSRIVATLGDSRVQNTSLRTISYGGAKMPMPVIRAALELFPAVDFSNAYGLTETSSTVSVLGSEDHRVAFQSDDPVLRARLGSAGQLLPGVEVEIRDDHGTVLPTAETGEIFVRGEQIAGEYLEGSRLDDKWFATRDRGYIDSDGYLFIEGRADDTIIRGGENIAPAEIEDVLREHGDVVDCAVVGIDDEEWGEKVGAAVVLAQGAKSSPEDLKAFARLHLRTSKTPDSIVIVDALPFTETGKLLRRKVREEVFGQL
ncbi:MAG: class I adenylate-forming enzyme family protein [Acidimicrobiales bacterium]